MLGPCGADEAVVVASRGQAWRLIVGQWLCRPVRVASASGAYFPTRAAGDPGRKGGAGARAGSLSRPRWRLLGRSREAPDASASLRPANGGSQSASMDLLLAAGPGWRSVYVPDTEASGSRRSYAGRVVPLRPPCVKQSRQHFLRRNRPRSGQTRRFPFVGLLQ